MGKSQRGNIWLLGVLAGFLLLGGADMYAHRPRKSPELKEKEQRAAFLRKWKPPLPIDSVAPGFSLKDAGGRMHSLAEFRGKPTLLDFYSDDQRSRTWAREMQKLWGHMGRSAMRCVAVVNFSPETARAFIRDTGDASLYLFEDPDHHPVRDLYGAGPGPHAWVIDSHGIILHASAPIQTDRHPDQDFEAVYQPLRAQIPMSGPGGNSSADRRGQPRPVAHD
jgi:peroxiredoxin